MIRKYSLRLGVIFLIILLFGGLVSFWWWDATAPVNPSATEPKIFVVSQGESVRSIARRLNSEQLIKDQVAFFLLVKFAKMDGSLQAGDFRLRPNMSAREIIDELAHGTLDVWVTLLEGWRVEEIALKLAQELSIPEQEFLKYAREGYMFPDTYLIPKEASAAAVVAMLSDNFQTKVEAEIRSGFMSQGLTEEAGIILASIVEREGKTDTDRPVIAGILINRLNEGWALQADATLQYALGYQALEKTWWKKALTNDDKKFKSSYNTYINTGLPPAPISNPGLSAIKAVANSVDSDYRYYLHDTSGKVHYAETLAAHEKNISQYLK